MTIEGRDNYTIVGLVKRGLLKVHEVGPVRRGVWAQPAYVVLLLIALWME